MKKPLICFLILLLILLPSLSYSTEVETFIKKDPILAGALSWYVPGLGQLYAGAYFKGAIFWVVEETLLVSTILTFAEFKLNVTGDINLGLNILSRENPNREEQRNALFLGAALLVVHFGNVIDAVNTTRKYNRSHEKDIYANVGYNERDESYRISINSKL